MDAPMWEATSFTGCDRLLTDGIATRFFAAVLA
jgi:hypothetical protein